MPDKYSTRVLDDSETVNLERGDPELLKQSLGTLLKQMREQRGFSQSLTHSAMGVSRQYLRRIEQGRSVPAIDFLLRLYSYLSNPEDEQGTKWLTVLLYKWVETKEGQRERKKKPNRQRADNEETREQSKKVADRQALDQQAKGKLLEIVEIVTRHNVTPPATFAPHRTKSLVNFPDDFLPLTIICGDRRLAGPLTRGDVFVKSAAISDLTFLPKLKLPEACVVRSDKIFAMIDERQLKETLGNTNVLVIGSPIVNLISREFNRHCLFRFIVDPQLPALEAKLQSSNFTNLERIRAFWRIAEDPLRQCLHEPDTDLPRSVLDELAAEVREIFDQIIPSQFIDDLIEGGVIDPADRIVKLHRNRYNDFAIISLGRNRYDENGNYICILAAGFGELGTAHAVRMLGEKIFAEHPFGGVVKVQRDTFKQPPKDFEEAIPHWHTSGYQPEKIAANLRAALHQPAPHFSLSHLTRDEIAECLKFTLRMMGQSEDDAEVSDIVKWRSA